MNKTRLERRRSKKVSAQTTNLQLAASPNKLHDVSDAASADAASVGLYRRGVVVKRAFDLCVIIVGGLVALPVIALIALSIKLGSGGPVFYSQERVGRYGRRISVFKFRTMIPNGEHVLAAHLAADPAVRDAWQNDRKLRNDPRVTKTGWILRRSSLDELPQLWNVLRGDMSLVGPRPIPFEEIPKYRDQFYFYIQAVPGLTGLWQVSGRNDTTYQQRVALDTKYVTSWSLWLDLKILIRTVGVVVGQRGAY